MNLQVAFGFRFFLGFALALSLWCVGNGEGSVLLARVAEATGGQEVLIATVLLATISQGLHLRVYMNLVHLPLSFKPRIHRPSTLKSSFSALISNGERVLSSGQAASDAGAEGLPCTVEG